ncbi:hypothetical protein ACFLV7_09915 [Chloroflexota bacterium]
MDKTSIPLAQTENKLGFFLTRTAFWSQSDVVMTQRAIENKQTQLSANITRYAKATEYAKGSPPVITSINFPSVIPGNKSTITGILYFIDKQGDMKTMDFDVLTADTFRGGQAQGLRLNSGDKYTGSYGFVLWCVGEQDVTLLATLVDEAGNITNSMDFSFTCK